MRRHIYIFIGVMFLFSAAFGAPAGSAKTAPVETGTVKKAAAENPAATQAKEDNTFFKEYILLGNKAYSDANWEEACNYYKEAYALKPSAEIQKLLQYCLERKKKIQEHDKKKIPKTTSTSDGIAINVFNLSAAAMAYFFYSDYAAKSEEYAAFVTGPIASPDERLMKLDLKDQMDGSQNTFVTMACVAGASIIYTAIDFLYIHAIFPENINTTLTPGTQGMIFAVNTRF